MKKFCLVIGTIPVLILVFLLLGCDSSSQSRPTALVGEVAPDFTLMNMDGEPVTLSELQGQVVLINFWATWCPPCREEKPTMEKLYQRFRDEGLVVLAVNVEENGHQVVSQYLMNYHYSFPIVLDPRAAVQSQYGVFRYPESFVVNREGVIVERVIGGRDWMANPAYRMIETLIRN